MNLDWPYKGNPLSTTVIVSSIETGAKYGLVKPFAANNGRRQSPYLSWSHACDLNKVTID